jgi:hypothetical protein
VQPRRTLARDGDGRVVLEEAAVGAAIREIGGVQKVRHEQVEGREPPQQALGAAVQVAFESKGFKPVFHLMGARVETGALSSYVLNSRRFL